MTSITLLIDGYNLLHATGAVQAMRGPGGLARARQRMLDQIAHSLTAEQRRTTQIVFDARRRGAQDADQVIHGMTVTFSVGYSEADELIQQIIRQHAQPRKLTVISDDLRIQRSAAARNALVVGCDTWLMQGPQSTGAPRSADGRDSASSNKEEEEEVAGRSQLNAEEVQKWLREFGLE